MKIEISGSFMGKKFKNQKSKIANFTFNPKVDC